VTAVSNVLFSKFQVGTRLTNSRLSDESLKAPGGCGGTSVEFIVAPRPDIFNVLESLALDVQSIAASVRADVPPSTVNASFHYL
jgi:hypothetical protein